MIRVASPVRTAIEGGRPVVALESTVLTHGLPRPGNLALARRLEASVRDAGAQPATIGVVAGALVVGLDEWELERLSMGPAEKAGLWNLAGLLARGADAGTTAATTLHAATRTGLRVFATGGIGGVHDTPFDESADLGALARTPVLTVCSGPKSMLDRAATLERLESAGVTVVGWKSDRLAGFLTAVTELRVPVRADSIDEIVAIVRAHHEAGLPGAVLVSRPEEDALAPERLAAWTERASAAAHEAGVRGMGVTPFLLARLAEYSEGLSVEINQRLLEGNARLAARIAVALAGERTGTGGDSVGDRRGEQMPAAARGIDRARMPDGSLP